MLDRALMYNGKDANVWCSLDLFVQRRRYLRQPKRLWPLDEHDRSVCIRAARRDCLQLCIYMGCEEVYEAVHLDHGMPILPPPHHQSLPHGRNFADFGFF
jgi:hypothetical protein